MDDVVEDDIENAVVVDVDDIENVDEVEIFLKNIELFLVDYICYLNMFQIIMVEK